MRPTVEGIARPVTVKAFLPGFRVRRVVFCSCGTRGLGCFQRRFGGPLQLSLSCTPSNTETVAAGVIVEHLCRIPLLGSSLADATCERWVSAMCLGASPTRIMVRVPADLPGVAVHVRQSRGSATVYPSLGCFTANWMRYMIWHAAGSNIKRYRSFRHCQSGGRSYKLPVS